MRHFTARKLADCAYQENVILWYCARVGVVYDSGVSIYLDVRASSRADTTTT